MYKFGSRMTSVALLSLSLGLLSCSKPADTNKKVDSSETAETEASMSTTVVIKTNKGDIEVQLDPEHAPASVENFLKYVDEKFYDGTIFHRVIAGFMIQGGGYDKELNRKTTGAPIKNEANNGLTNDTGTISMARTNVVDSATSQFFINVTDNHFLNHKSDTPQGYGYAVFGKVVGGMDVVRAIENTPTANKGGAFANAPVDPVIIESIRRK
jgi:cyclophilin family peptidyl-prolyl cis-trans isomerase